VLLIAAVVVLRVTSQFIAPETVRPASTDIFAAAQVRDLRMALDLYRREHGSFPATLQELVAERWVTRDRLQVAGHELRYLSQRDRQAYQLELSAGQ
jgi:type II secretory pathway pseudopilin PulG